MEGNIWIIFFGCRVEGLVHFARALEVWPRITPYDWFMATLTLRAVRSPTLPSAPPYVALCTVVSARVESGGWQEIQGAQVIIGLGQTSWSNSLKSDLILPSLSCISSIYHNVSSIYKNIEAYHFATATSCCFFLWFQWLQWENGGNLTVIQWWFSHEKTCFNMIQPCVDGFNNYNGLYIYYSTLYRCIQPTNLWAFIPNRFVWI